MGRVGRVTFACRGAGKVFSSLPLQPAFVCRNGATGFVVKVPCCFFVDMKTVQDVTAK